ncbi:hypothetical protein PVA45_07610 (plasmid) [Entomospira entomophila]|uniref:Uncharacterized protein n=1 Tax=Entomospira entomophila TaxID=2719988 RepID=A0A968GCV7_9SPIO|nr:hypothetical protein [Entomospira entomophilus]NIZ41273.1 hypothetical protein [Entomospira entomophilus]WDI36199.1 hypothetical protein PVA45_07610 [Entomospira entomophilus]
MMIHAKVKRLVRKYLENRGFYLYKIPSSCDKSLLSDPDLQNAASQIITSQLYTQGTLRSHKEKIAVDRDGNPIPWMTYPFIDYSKTIDLSDKVIFEYGAGNGTLYWAKRCKKIYSVENDANWYQRMISLKPENSTIYLETDQKLYAKSIEKPGCRFDMIIVDGGCCRGDAIIEAVRHLSDGGMIVLDNANRFMNIHRFLFSQGFVRFSFEGLTPSALHGNSTSLFLYLPKFPFKQQVMIETMVPDYPGTSDISAEQMRAFGLEPYPNEYDNQ